MLLDKGADINVQSGYYSNALHAALEGGYNQVIRLLLNYDTILNRKYIKTELHFIWRVTEDD